MPSRQTTPEVHTTNLCPSADCLAAECRHQWHLAALCSASKGHSTPLPHQDRADQSTTHCKVRCSDHPVGVSVIRELCQYFRVQIVFVLGLSFSASYTSGGANASTAAIVCTSGKLLLRLHNPQCWQMTHCQHLHC